MNMLPPASSMPLNTFKILSFDIYGTLIDWESGILANLHQLTDRLASDSPHAALKDHSDQAALWAVYKKAESELQAEQPGLKYDHLLEQVYLRIAESWGIDSKHTSELQAEARAFGGSIGTWPAFPDTVDAMTRLAKHYRLVPLSNVAREPFARTCAGPLAGVSFWRVYTAEDIGSYKPDLRNFEYLLEHLDADDRAAGGAGVTKEEVLHVAQSLFHDHVPAKTIGLTSCWIARKGPGMDGIGGDWVRELHEKGQVGYGWRFGSLGELADAVEKELEGKAD
jgi:2-haloalkanoic acid dehalogenase type II